MISGLVKIISINALPDGTGFKDLTWMYKPKIKQRAVYQSSWGIVNVGGGL